MFCGGSAPVFYKIHRSTIAIVIPMFFFNLFPIYSIIPWFFLAIIGLYGIHALMRDPFGETPVKWRLPILILSGAVICAFLWLFRGSLAAGVSQRYGSSGSAGSMALFLFYPFIKENGYFEKLWRRGQKIYLTRFLFVVLIAGIDVAIYFLDPFSSVRALLNDGKPLLSILVLSAYSFALTVLFYRLELKAVLKSDKDADSYKAWLTLPAFTTANALILLWSATGIAR